MSEIRGRAPGWHPQCISFLVIEPLANNTNYQLARKLLDASVLRHEAIASNIANAETPGYRRVDVAPDFHSVLRAQFAGGQLPPREVLAGLQPQLAEDRGVRSVRPDGNSVELESELLALGRNRVEHDFLTDLVTSNIKSLRTAISGRVTP
jgi:flagellar basal-body rod protein FlgB